MTNTPAKPREWYLHGSKVYPTNGINGLINLSGPRLSDEVVHVIERSAYDQLQRELAFVKTQWKQTSDLLEQERNRLTAELADVRKERDELLAKGKGNVFVHRHHYDQALSQAAALAGALEKAKAEYWNRCYAQSGNIKAMTLNEFDAFVDRELAAYRAWEKERGR